MGVEAKNEKADWVEAGVVEGKIEEGVEKKEGSGGGDGFLGFILRGIVVF